LTHEVSWKKQKKLSITPKKNMFRNGRNYEEAASARPQTFAYLLNSLK
jgi:hypothetical protein